MNWLSFASVVVFAVSLGEGIYIFALEPKNPVNRRFLFMTFCLAVWLFGAAFAYSGRTKEEVVLWFRICSFGFIFLHGATLTFCLSLTKILKRPAAKYLSFLIYVPSFYFMYRSVTGFFVFRDFVRLGRLWIGLPDYGSRVFLVFIANYIVYYLVSAVLLLYWRTRTHSTREKMQAVIIVVSILGTILLYNFEPFILPLVTNYKSFVISPVFSIVWISGIGYAIRRYRFLSWSPKHLSGVIVDEIDEAVIVLDREYEVLYLNRAAKKLLFGEREDGPEIGTPLNDIVENPSAFTEDLRKLVDGSRRSLSCRLYLKGVERVYADLKCFSVSDSAGSIMGITMVGRRIADPCNPVPLFKLSDKENEALSLLMQGRRIAEIAQLMAISPRTVKAHSAHIYAKLGVKNKIELLRKLETLNLMPEHSAESSVFPLLKKDKK